MAPDPGGPKTYRSEGSATLNNRYRYLFIYKLTNYFRFYSLEIPHADLTN
jgi:hypothetical protein